MAQLTTVVLTDSEWREILEKYGHGNVPKRYRYEELDDSDPRFVGHHVVHGRNTQTGDLTTTGFLRNQTNQVVAGVDGIPN